MSFVDSIHYRIRALFRRREFDRDVDEEFAFHLSLHIADQRREGLSPAVADHVARRAVGNVTYLKEELRQMSMLRLADAIRQDARYAFRVLARSPVFTIVTVLTLALGVGANTAIFSLIFSVLFAQLPVAHAKELVQLQVTGQRVVDQFRLADYRELRRTPVAGVADLSAFAQTVARVEAGHLDDYVGVDLVSDNYFSALGLGVARGRTFDGAIAGGSATTVVISDGFWARFFDRDPAAVGRKVLIAGVPFTVVGIAPPAFNGIGFPAQFVMAVPIEAAVLVAPNRSGESERGVRIIARMRQEGSAERAAFDFGPSLQACCAGTNGLLAAAGKGAHMTARSIAQGIPNAKEDLRLEYRQILIVLMCGVAALLLIACVNVANLLTSRAVMRQREFSIRLALGASRGRVLRQCLVESAILAIGGGLVGIVVASGAIRVLSAQLSADTGARLGAIIAFHPNAPVLAFAACISLLTGLLFGVLPAMRSTALDIGRSLREAGRPSRGSVDGALRKVFVVTQFVFSLVLLVLAGLFARSLQNLRRDRLGFDPSHVLAVQVDPRSTSYQDRPLVPLYDAIMTRARTLPGTQLASLSSYTPAFGGLNLTSTVSVAGHVPSPGEDLPQFDYVSSDFLATVGARFIAGRAFSDDEEHGRARVAVVNRAFAHRYFGNSGGLGRQIQIPEDITVVGVVEDIRFEGPGSEPQPMLFLPYSQWPGDWRYLTLTVRTDGAPIELAQSVRSLLNQVAPGIRVPHLTTLEDQVDRVLERERFAAWLSAIFGIVAVCLVAVGLYGVVAYLAAARTTEFGVRVALGADAASVLWLVLRDSLMLSILGIAIGLPAALGASRFAASQLYRVGAADPVTVAGAAFALLLISALAALLPAAKAARVDPLIALRSE